MPQGRKVDNRQTPMRQPHPPIGRPPFAGIIGAAVRHRIPPDGQPSAISTKRRPASTDYSAHEKMAIELSEYP
jgi:hypothetical protein